ncbi:hypothetical protein [Nitrospira sp. Kam-Ns4a]
MQKQSAVADRIIEAVSQNPGCLIEELVLACPELTWNQVFFQVDHLSRTGRLILARRAAGVYTLQIPDAGGPVAAGKERTR